jgi:preprotein translocase subunit SecA
MDHIDAMDSLQSSVGLQAYGHKDPFMEYKIYGSQMFDQMVYDIRCDTVRQLLTRPQKPEDPVRKAVIKIVSASHGGDGSTIKKSPVKKTASEKTGRNDPCPCGSGLKYKKRCGKNAADGE